MLTRRHCVVLSVRLVIRVLVRTGPVIAIAIITGLLFMAAIIAIPLISNLLLMASLIAVPVVTDLLIAVAIITGLVTTPPVIAIAVITGLLIMAILRGVVRSMGFTYDLPEVKTSIVRNFTPPL